MLRLNISPAFAFAAHRHTHFEAMHQLQGSQCQGVTASHHSPGSHHCSWCTCCAAPSWHSCCHAGCACHNQCCCDSCPGNAGRCLMSAPAAGDGCGAVHGESPPCKHWSAISGNTHFVLLVFGGRRHTWQDIGCSNPGSEHIKEMMQT